MTKKEMFELIATVNADNTEIVDFCNHEIELLANRKVSKKPTKTQEANEGIKNVILEVIAEAGVPIAIKAMRENERLAEYAPQKISALLTQLRNAGKVEKTYEGKTAVFALA